MKVNDLRHALDAAASWADGDLERLISWIDKPATAPLLGLTSQIKTIDHDGLCGRMHPPEDGDVGMPVRLIVGQAQNVGAPPENPEYVVEMLAVTEDGRLVELADYELAGF